MKQFKIKPEHYDAWGVTEDTSIVTEDEIARLAQSWGMNIDDLMEQVEEEEDTMKITTTERTVTDRHFNGFHQIVTEAPEKVERIEVIGSLDELLAYSRERDVLIRRSEATERLFPSWDGDARFAILANGEPVLYATRASEFGSARLTTVAHGVVE